MFGVLDNIGPFNGQLMPKLFMSFADDLVPEPADDGDAQNDSAPVVDPPAPAPTPAPTPTPTPTGWKSGLGEDLSKAPLIQGFEDTPEGLKKAVESHVNLEKLLGHEKVPIPKGPEDIEGIARFNKAMGIPDKVEGYNLPDANLHGEMANLTFDKASFAQIALENSLTPKQAESLWNKYTEMSGGIYQTHLKAVEDKMNENKNALMAYWGDSYANKIELGDMVVAKFADDQAMGDFITASLSKDPMGQKFLAKIGQQFSENKVGEFQYQRHGISSEEALSEITKIRQDSKHPYSNPNAPQKEHDAAVEHMNRLISISRKKTS